MLWRTVSTPILLLKLACRPWGTIYPVCAKASLNPAQQLKNNNNKLFQHGVDEFWKTFWADPFWGKVTRVAKDGSRAASCELSQ